MATATAPQPIKVYLTIGELSMKLGFHRDAAYRVMERTNDRPPGFIMGGRYMMFDPDYLHEIREWLVSHRIECRHQIAAEKPADASPTTTPDSAIREQQAVLAKYAPRKRQPATA
jgi:predicted DNA-binding transcriptional regulator AlpA